MVVPACSGGCASLLALADDRADTNEPWIHSYGEHPRGYVIYDSTGHVSIQFCADPPTPPSLSRDDFAPTASEALHAYENFVAYFGTYTVDDSKKIVIHHVEGSLLPSYTNTDQTRPFTLSGDRLERGDGQTWRRAFERVR